MFRVVFPAFLLAISVGWSQESMATDLSGDLSDNTTGALTPGVYEVVDTIRVPRGETLTIEAGAILKFHEGVGLFVFGVLMIDGVSELPVVFTSIKDDSVGGDTNGDGNATLPLPGDWERVTWSDETGQSVARYLEVRYAGSGGFAGVLIYGVSVDITLDHCVFRDIFGSGLDLVNLPSHPTVSHCTFVNNSRPIGSATLSALPRFTHNTAIDNTTDQIAVWSSGRPDDVVIRPENILGGALVFEGSVEVREGQTMIFEAGVIGKFRQFRQIHVAGSLICRGTATQPVVFTSYFDDEFGGDSDASLHNPETGDWDGILIFGDDSHSTMEQVVVRYAQAGLTAHTDLLSLENIRLDRCSRGFTIRGTVSPAENLVAYECALEGFFLEETSTDIIGATAYGNQVGILAGAGFSGRILSSIAFDNHLDNYQGLVPGQLQFSNGDSQLEGIDGNINSDPSFVDAPEGDLRLQADSPCIDAGDPSQQPVGADLGQVPRLMDGDLNGSMRVDMGAYEYTNTQLQVTGTWTPGADLTISLDGKPNLTAFLFAGIRQSQSPFASYGELYIDLLAPSLILPWPSAPSHTPLSLPSDLPTPLPVVLQILSVEPALPSSGNVSNLVSARIQ